MIVYRFERDGLGPYVNSTQGVVIGAHFGKKKKTRSEAVAVRRFKEQPAYRSARGVGNWQIAHSDKQYIFGCSSKEQLRLYFAGSFKKLFKQGYRIKRYRVPDDKIIDMGFEVAFPVKYHKFQNLKSVEKAVKGLRA